jgi:hypothetical protein
MEEWRSICLIRSALGKCLVSIGTLIDRDDERIHKKTTGKKNTEAKTPATTTALEDKKGKRRRDDDQPERVTKRQCMNIKSSEYIASDEETDSVTENPGKWSYHKVIGY